MNRKVPTDTPIMVVLVAVTAAIGMSNFPNDKFRHKLGLHQKFMVQTFLQTPNWFARLYAIFKGEKYNNSTI